MMNHHESHMATSDGTHRPRRFVPGKRGVWVAAAGLASAAAVFTAFAVSGTATAATTPPGGSGGGARSGAADGGSTGIVDATTAAGFTMKTATGVEVTVEETSSTKTLGGPARAVRSGTSVLVLGTVDSDTVSAAQVVVQRNGDGGAAAAKAAGVIPFQKGVPSPTKTIGEVPGDYTEGDGTIVSGPTAYKAVKAAQAIVPGGINDRVVLLSDGEYEVHNISVNWPHHVFVSKDFKVLGAE